MPHERKSVLRDEAAALLDRLLTRRARRRGAVEVAIGEYLAMLRVGDRTMRLGYAGIGDYAREILGIAARTALRIERLARELRGRPQLREAVWTGEVSARKAEIVLPVARGESEQLWMERARKETVRALEAAVEAAGRSTPPEEDEPWDLLCIQVPAEGRAEINQAMENARKVVGHTAPKWQRFEALCEEFHGAYGGHDEGGPDRVLRWPLPVSKWLEPLKEHLEKETAQWAFLAPIDAVVAPAMEEETDPHKLDAELRRLAAERRHWDEGFGRLAAVFRDLGLWSVARFASFGQYCSERLGMIERAVEQRIALERRLVVLPALRRALRDGRVSYEQARLIAGKATDSTVDEWIVRAGATSCVALRREIEATEEAQMWARDDFDVRLPRSTADLFASAYRAARKLVGESLTSGECLVWMAQHFNRTWGPLMKRKTLSRKILERDLGYCQVWGCSRPADHAHHVKHRAQGGSDDPSNQTGVCAAHHLIGLHEEYISVSGKAPDGLKWEGVVRPGATAAGQPGFGSSAATGTR
jgi:hypothetical protein